MRLLTCNIIDESFDEQDVERLRKYAQIVKNNNEDQNAHYEIWEYDKSIGGYGGYAAPLDPTVNPFNRLGDYRNVFRSLQYARCDMFIGCRPRHIIIDSALHVETLVKILLSNNIIATIVTNRRQLGSNIEALYKKHLIDELLYNRLLNYKKILNLAKHDTDPTEENTFDYEDAVVFYFETRKIGYELLKLLNHYSCDEEYEICMQ